MYTATSRGLGKGQVRSRPGHGVKEREWFVWFEWGKAGRSEASVFREATRGREHVCVADGGRR